jgi:hypothetical protein
MTLPATDCPYLGAGEIELLALLALFQRQRLNIEVDLDSALRDCLIRCAVWLDSASARLGYRTVTRSSVGSASMLQTDSMPRSKASDSESNGTTSSGTLQARTLRFVGDHGVVSTHELNRFGASRQMISIMFKRGLLKRVRFGAYAAAPEALARLNSSR